MILAKTKKQKHEIFLSGAVLLCSQISIKSIAVTQTIFYFIIVYSFHSHSNSRTAFNSTVSKMKFGVVIILLSLLTRASCIFSATRRHLKKEKKSKSKESKSRDKNNGLKMGKRHPATLSNSVWQCKARRLVYQKLICTNCDEEEINRAGQSLHCIDCLRTKSCDYLYGTVWNFKWCSLYTRSCKITERKSDVSSWFQYRTDDGWLLHRSRYVSFYSMCT